MGTIQIKYEEVYAKAAKLRERISSNIVERTESEYGQIESKLSQADGAANASLKEVMEANRQKALEAAYLLDKLVNFIANSAKQIEINEQKIARGMTLGRK